jgi:hypothetical protein
LLLCFIFNFSASLAFDAVLILSVKA